MQMNICAAIINIWYGCWCYCYYDLLRCIRVYMSTIKHYLDPFGQINSKLIYFL